MNLVPTQVMGAKSDNKVNKNCSDSRAATKKYNSACSKLLDINNWSQTAGNVLEIVFTKCEYMCKSEPQIAVDVIFKIISLGSLMIGSSTASKLTLTGAVNYCCFHKLIFVNVHKNLNYNSDKNKTWKLQNLHE